MVPEDRDRRFEKALARHLRTRASAAACPDAETLAAYHERSLTPDELNNWNQHMTVCVRCKEVLAQLEATRGIPVSAGVISLPQSPKRQRAAHRRWLAPAGALAAGLLVWVAVHERQAAKVMQPAKIEVAENRTPAVPPVSTSASVDREKGDKLAAPSKATKGTDNRAALTGDLTNRRAQSAEKKVVVMSPEAAFEKSDRKDADLNTVAQAPQVATENGTAGGLAGASKSKQTDELSMAERGVNDLVQLQASGANSAAGRHNPLPQTESKAMKTVPPPAPRASAETLELSPGSREASAFRMAKSRFPRLVPAPGGKVIWRLGAPGLIEQSTDSGLTWTTQASGTTADLFLGSAPSETVCWVIGTGGTILRTADGGTHWITVTSPISEKLYLIRASDALHATLWDMTRRHSFQTEDGGVTWTQITSQ